MTDPSGMSSTRAPLLVLAVAVLALIAAGCGSDADDGSATTAEPAAGAPTEADSTQAGQAEKAEKPKPSPKPKPTGTRIKLGPSAFGEILFDANDQAIYLFDKEKSSKSECYGDCAVEWPPVLTKGEPRAKGGISQKKLGTTKRDDGKTQVTYNGHPLYYYFDEGPTEVRCHNVPGFGGLWLVLDAAGNAV
jgi:predicted lipoprotein with Yx(FWY)xxD motif